MARRRTLITLAAATLMAFAATALVVSDGREWNPADAAPGGPVTAEQQVAAAEAALRDHPNDGNALANLAGASLTRMKQTGDSSWYVRAAAAATHALRIDPGNVLALEAKATLANARHRFRDAIAPARAAVRLAPDRFAGLEILTDAYIELGRYDEAFATAKKRLELRPDLSSYSRASYAAELRGEDALATELMELAADSGKAGSGDRTWAIVQTGLLRLRSGDIPGAEADMRAALAATPHDPTAIAGMAHVTAVKGDLKGAVELYRSALDRQPIAAYASGIAELEYVRGNRAEFARALARSREIDAAEARNGVLLDLDQAAMEADFSRPDEEDVLRARAGHAQRTGVVGDDHLGWVLTRAGRCGEGLRYARRSLRLGTRDALMLFHAAVAARCSGERAEAARYLTQALELNPRFSVRWSPVANRMLGELAGR
jgi:tetratricopeptide (TPR) repeat protein